MLERTRTTAWVDRPKIPCVACGQPTGWLLSSGRLGALHPSCKPWSHGTRVGYRQKMCRCSECRDWNRRYNKAYRQALRDQGLKLPGGSGPWISPKTRLAVFERDSWKCQLCLEPVDGDADPQSSWYPSLDHIVPQSKGGGHDVGNLRTAHRWCNSIRGAGNYHADLMSDTRR